MARFRPIGSQILLRLSACALVACNAIAGIGAPVLETSDGGSTAPGADAAGPPVTDASGGQPGTDSSPGTNDANGDDGGTNPTDAMDATSAPDTFTPPPPAAKPGYDITAGGTYGTSASFSLIATVSESPGGNNVGKSSNFVLKAGVIAVTQPN